VRSLYERFAGDGLEVVYLGAMETEDSCRAWKEEYRLEFPVIPDPDGALFRAFTNGWVPWSVLIGPDGRVVFSENEFDEAGFSAAIRQLYEQPAAAKPTAARVPVSAGCTVVLGGGSGGLVAARELRRRVPAGHRVVLIDRSADHIYQPSLLWQMVGERRPEQFRRPLSRLERKGIEFQNAEVEKLDLENNLVRTSSGELGYDSLVVSLGAQLAPETVPGFEQTAYNLYTSEGCARIHAALEDLSGGTIGILITAMPFKCPAAPYEAAFLAESFVRRKGIRRNVEIHLFTPEQTPMPVAPATIGDSIADMLAARERGTLLRGEADYQLHWIYFWYEDQPQRGLAVLQDLRRRYPHNPLFVQRIAEVQHEYFHDRAASLATWLALLDAAEAGRVNAAGFAAVRARLGAAEHFDALGETDRGIDLVAPLLARPPAAPYGALARAQLLAGTFYDRVGRRADAVSAYRAAIAAAAPDDVHEVAPQARQRLRRGCSASLPVRRGTRSGSPHHPRVD